MDISFGCTQCGRCCHDLRLTLSVAEARAWAARGHTVELLAEGWPWPDTGPHPDDAVMQWRRTTTFPVTIGDVPFRVNLQLVARHEGACPHLLPDMRCGNYEVRPRICRIYPLESRPFEAMEPARRLCPPEAWDEGLPVLERDGAPAEAEAAAVIEAHRATMIADVPVKERLARVIGRAELAMAGEGLAVWEIAPDVLVAALDASLGLAEQGSMPEDSRWAIVTNRETTRAMLAELECPARLVVAGDGFLAAFGDQV
jgi:Fe-S-cluster containining protein